MRGAHNRLPHRHPILGHRRELPRKPDDLSKKKRLEKCRLSLPYAPTTPEYRNGEVIELELDPIS